MMKNKKTINTYKPNILIITGSIFNIIFASLFSVIPFAVVLTIPTIVFNALLLIPRTDNKKYWAVWRIVPIILSFILALIVFLSIFSVH